jgi:hypothetical protein
MAGAGSPSGPAGPWGPRKSLVGLVVPGPRLIPGDSCLIAVAALYRTVDHADRSATFVVGAGDHAIGSRDAAVG